MYPYRVERAGYFRASDGVGNNDHAGGSGRFKCNDRHFSHASDGNFSSVCKLGRQFTSDIYGKYGCNAEHIKAFGKMMEKEL